MTKRRPVYLMLGLDEKGQLLRHFIVEGCGGPLLLLWSIGISLFLTVFGSPFYAVAWTVMAVTLGLWMTYRSRGNPRVWERLVHASMAERFPWHTISDEALRETVRKSSILVAEVTLKIYGLRRASGARNDLARVLATASNLLDLQLELAREVESLTRGLTLMVPDDQVGVSLITDAPTLRQDTVAAVEKQIDQARALAGAIYQQLETLILQVCQLETLPNIPLGAERLAGEIEADLNRVQEKINILNQPNAFQEVSPSPPDLKFLSESLRAGFNRKKSTQGLMALQRLTYEYSQLQQTLERWNKDESTLVVLIPDLAEETYRQGLRVLRHVLELVQVIPSSDEAVLGEEVIRLEREIEALRNDTSQASLVKVRLQTLVYYQYRLSLQEQQSLRVEELLSQAGRCEASLNQARMQLVLLSAAESQQGADAVTETLSRVIQQAKEVQQELNELGF